MAGCKRLIEVLFSVIVAVSSQQLVEPCLKLPTNKAKVLVGDTYAIDLEAITQGSNAKFEVITNSSSIASDAFTLVRTFNDQYFESQLTTELLKCSSWSTGAESHQYYFVCNSNKILWLSMDKVKQTVEKQLILSLNQGAECHSIKYSFLTKAAYVACFLPANNGIMVSSIRLIEGQLSESATFSIEASGDTILSKSLTIFLEDNRRVVDATEQNLMIYVYEQLGKPAIRIFRDKLGTISGGGWFSANDNTLVDFVPAKISALFEYSGSLGIVSQVDQIVRIHLCSKVPIYNKLTCSKNGHKRAKRRKRKNNNSMHT